MLAATTGARPGKINMMFSPNSASARLFPERNPSPRPTSSSNDPTPQATPNMVRNERSLCAHRVRMICAKMSRIIRIITNIVPLTISRKTILVQRSDRWTSCGKSRLRFNHPEGRFWLLTRYGEATNMTAQVWLNTNLVRLQEAAFVCQLRGHWRGLKSSLYELWKSVLAQSEQSTGGTNESKLSFGFATSAHAVSNCRRGEVHHLWQNERW